MIELDEPDESNAEAEPENAGEINAENQGNRIQNEGYQLRDRMTLRLPARYQGDLLLAEIEELLSYREAIQSEEAANWKKAMNEEYKSLTQNHAWELMEAPKNSTIIDCKWTYKLKRDANGNIQRYKARLVARGFRQQAGIDYQETHSPVVRFDSIRAVLPVASYMKIRQFDVKTAFLYGDIEETIYMQQPEGYEDKTGRICRLRRSLYELKQSSRCWNKCFTEFLQRFNLKATQADSCIFISQNQKQKLILAIYIDDGLIVAQDQISINKLLSELEAKFEITHHNTNMFLGIHIERETDGSIFLHQEAYAKRVLQRFKMEEANWPFLRIHIKNYAPHKQEMKVTSRQHLIVRQSEALCICRWRPDITFAVHQASRHLEKPLTIHWKAVKRILKYLKGTINHGLKFKCGQKRELLAYSDADYAGDLETRRSTTGCVLKLASGTISWNSQKQRVVALSTTDAEYMAACQTAKEIAWVKTLINVNH